MGSVVVVSAVAVLDRDGRMLTVRKRGTARFMNPGGKPEPGETPVEAAVRELHEELGLVLDPSALRPLGTWTAPAANEPDTTVVAHAFRTDLPPGAEPVAQAEIDELRWVTPSDLVAGDDAVLNGYAPLLVQRFLPALLIGR